MNDELVPLCALRLGDDVLSAWHDTELRGAVARRVAVHLPNCTPCQMRLSAFEAVGALLRAQPIPAPRPNALIELNARIITRYPRRAAREGSHSASFPHPGSWRGLLALIVVLLLAALFARLLTASLHHATGHPTPYLAPHSVVVVTAKETLWLAKTS